MTLYKDFNCKIKRTLVKLLFRLPIKARSNLIMINHRLLRSCCLICNAIKYELTFQLVFSMMYITNQLP